MRKKPKDVATVRHCIKFIARLRMPDEKTLMMFAERLRCLYKPTHVTEDGHFSGASMAWLTFFLAMQRPRSKMLAIISLWRWLSSLCECVLYAPPGDVACAMKISTVSNRLIFPIRGQPVLSEVLA